MGIDRRLTLCLSAPVLAASLCVGSAASGTQPPSYAATDVDTATRIENSGSVDFGQGTALALVDIPTERQIFYSGPSSDFSKILAGTRRERGNDNVADRKTPRGQKKDDRSAPISSAPVVAPALQELPMPSRAPRATRPVRAIL